MATIAIIGALEKEVAQIKEELSGTHESQEAGLTVVNGGLSGLTVVATTAGMGTVNAAAATQHLISKYAPQAVVFSGIAGGLNPKLHINDVVIGKCLRYLDTDTALIAESAPGLEEFASTPALADVAAVVLAEHGFVDASLDVAAAEMDPKQFLCGTIATGERTAGSPEKMYPSITAGKWMDYLECRCHNGSGSGRTGEYWRGFRILYDICR